MIELTDGEKIKAFNKIASNYFNKNFGSLSKSDFEVLLFSEYIEHFINNSMNYSDYALSKELGITQNRVRALKEKKELKYPNEGFDWRNGLIDPLKTAKYDKLTHTVKLIIPDVNVQIEFRNYVESNGWYDEFSLNKKLSVIPISGFVEIWGKDIEYNDEVKNHINEICKANPELLSKDFMDFMADFSKESLKSFLMKGSAEVIKLILGALPFGSLAKPAINLLIKALGD